jgi:hypothetical protein
MDNPIVWKTIWWCSATYLLALFVEWMKNLSGIDGNEPWFTFNLFFLLSSVIVCAVAVEYFVWLYYDCDKMEAIDHYLNFYCCSFTCIHIGTVFYLSEPKDAD